MKSVLRAALGTETGNVKHRLHQFREQKIHMFRLNCGFLDQRVPAFMHMNIKDKIPLALAKQKRSF